MENLIISYPVRSPKSFQPNGVLSYLADKYGYIALEVTVSRSTIAFVKSLLKKIQNEYEDLPLYFRFHAPVMPEYDPFLSSDGIESITNFISKNYKGGYLVVHSNSDLPDKASIDAARKLASHAKGKGIILCLENLASGWSSDPKTYLDILASTGMKGILDIGHLYSSDSVRYRRLSLKDAVENLLPYLCGAHVYEYESGGHHPALDPYLVGEVLTTLRNGGVSWWTVELEDENSFFGTLKTIENLFQIL
jgi:sugar phosphate isomerase/epimerase